MSQQPLDDNYKPIYANLYDASGNQYVSPMAGTVTTDSGGEKYAPHVVSVGDGTTPTQKLAIDASGNASVNVAEINGVAPSMGNGASGTGVQRVTIANDSTGQVALAAGTAVVGTVEIGDGTTPTQKLAVSAAGEASVDVAKISGAAVPLGHGLAATAIRIELPTDGTGVVGLNAGSNLVGGVEIYDGAGVNKLAVSVAGEASADIKKIGGSALALGQAAMAASLPVTLSSDQYPGDVTILASGSRTTTQTGSDLTNSNAKGVRVVLDMTDVTASPSVTLSIEAKDAISGKYSTLLTGAAVTTVTTNVYVVYPGLTPSANAIVSDVLPHTWRAKVTANNANAGIYSVGASYLY